MKTKSWRRLPPLKKWVLPRENWDAGPWDNEPDKVQWLDVFSGYPCLIVRGPMGNLCGYVGVPPFHPWYGLPYNRCTLPMCESDEEEGYCQHSPDCIIDCHRGLTYSNHCLELRPVHELSNIWHEVEPGDPAHIKLVWWFGFDCGHYMDLSPGLVAMARWANTMARESGHGDYLDELEAKVREMRPMDFEMPEDTYKDMEYVGACVRRMARQLRDIYDQTRGPIDGRQRDEGVQIQGHKVPSGIDLPSQSSDEEEWHYEIMPLIGSLYGLEDCAPFRGRIILTDGVSVEAGWCYDDSMVAFEALVEYLTTDIKEPQGWVRAFDKRPGFRRHGEKERR